MKINTDKEFEELDKIWNEEDSDPEKFTDPLNDEEELAQEGEDAWNDTKAMIEECIEMFSEKNEKELFESFIILSVTLDELWYYNDFSARIQFAIFDLFKKEDATYLSQIETKLYFCMYDNTDDLLTSAEIADHIIKNEISKNFPYPDYYVFQVERLIEDSEDLDSEVQDEIKQRFAYLFN